MSKSRRIEIIGSICFIIASLILGVTAISRDQFLRHQFPRLTMGFGNDTYSVSVTGLNPVYIFAVLFFIAILLVVKGFMTEKKRYVTIGAIVGIVAQCLSCSGLLYSIERLQFCGEWRYPGKFDSSLWGPGVPFELLFILFFVAILLCSLDCTHSQICGAIGAVLILVRLIPAGYLFSYLNRSSLFFSIRNSKFKLSPWAIVVSILFASGSVLLGLFFAPEKVKKNNKTKESITKIEKITRLKELLDNGAITQEEFEEKKKEILKND